MDFPLFLAMTASEFAACDHFPRHTAYMSCHFSPSGTGLSGIPTHLPAGSVLMLTDQLPPSGHDPDRIAGELLDAVQQLDCSAVFLDLQRPDLKENFAVAKSIANALPCPVVVSAEYAKDLTCGVLLPPPPLWTTLQRHIQSWKGRSIWLEAATEGAEATVTGQGSSYTPCACDPLTHSFQYPKLHIDYQMTLHKDRAVFHMRRNRLRLEELLQEAEAMGVQGAVGLYQQLAQKNAPL